MSSQPVRVREMRVFRGVSVRSRSLLALFAQLNLPAPGY
jgi:hypothetical protein